MFFMFFVLFNKKCLKLLRVVQKYNKTNENTTKINKIQTICKKSCSGFLGFSAIGQTRLRRDFEKQLKLHADRACLCELSI